MVITVTHKPFLNFQLKINGTIGNSVPSRYCHRVSSVSNSSHLGGSRAHMKNYRD